ncbi:MAG: hypothetical protein DMG14_16345 [Acidobacteria bacterium]|nr:MAG: hypothetical protein DMG14_16345 [Acidobacteriota bacterium]
MGLFDSEGGRVGIRSIVAFAIIVTAGGLLLLDRVTSMSQDAGPQRAVRPVPRWPDGRVNLNSPPGEKGLWGGSGRLAVNPRSYEPRTTLRAPIHIDDVPLQDWARALVDYRHINFLKDEPYTRCKPSPGPRLWLTAYGFEILDVPELQRIYVFNNGGPHSFHTIYMDGRTHPKGKDLVPGYLGHSVGHWEGDTLVVDSVGFNERVWMNRDALPHTDQLHLIERLTRVDFNTLKYEITVDDPGAYTAPWTTGFSLQWTPGEPPANFLTRLRRAQNG